MAEGRTITIRIISQSNSAPSPDAKEEDANKPSQSASVGSGSGNEGGGGSKAAVAFAAYYFTKQTLQTIKSTVMLGYSRYQNLTEDYQGQQVMQNAQAVIGEVASVGGATISGAMTGAKIGGPWGAVIGAVLGTVTGIAGAVNKRAETFAQQEKQLHEEAYSLYFNTERAGMVNYSRGTEN